MAALFTGKILMANRERDEMETERELGRALENKVLLLYFGSGQCPRCRRFSPILKDFFIRLTDEFYVERASQLVLVYVSRDETEEQQRTFLRSMPRRWLAVPFGDSFKRELELRFSVAEVPTVVVLKPNGDVIVGNAVEEIQRLGTACFRNWQEAAELVDRNFLLAEDFEDWSRRSITDPIRRLKYKLDKKTEAKNKGRKEDGEEFS
ncbi:Nucleoredoxin-like 1 [Antrostomus carolinensis]|uniref:Nucleoredoxin-like 1 n=1 Tax=Antrostomus carolinensis TaxID=279965 RepID=A0A094KV79_ANTCR|nr:nucleoredoxin-like protein 1 [Antrostomus carolinensis]KFZ55378.1 Nucleoredoxin-like 1 [Antrostomus carolinensis]